MARKPEFYFTSLLSALACIVLLLNNVFCVLADNGSKTPNVLFIMSDDQDSHMKSMDYMPHVKNLLAANGTTFQKHYCTTALCCPSRISLFTGKCVHNTNVTDVRLPFGAYPKFVSEGLNDDYLPLWLQDGGINTYYVGKFSNGHSIHNYRDPEVNGWTDSNFLLEPGMYDYENTTWARKGQQWKSFPNQNAVTITGQYALEMLSQAANSGKPFFLTVAPTAPHVGLNASGKGSFFPIPQKKWENAFGDETVPRAPNFNPQKPSGVSWLQNLPYQNETLIERLDQLYRARLRVIAGLDDMVADLVSALEKHGILNNTHIIYTTDNGYHIGQHRMGPGKRTGYETDINIPMVWRGPGVPVNKITNTVSTHTDLAPTFLDLFGLPRRTQLDGSIMPLTESAMDASVGSRVEHVNVEHWGAAHTYEVVAPHKNFNVAGEHNNTYKSVRIMGDGYNIYYSVWCTNEHELYDMTTDGYQMDNLLPKVRDIAQVPDRQLLGRPLSNVVARLDTLLLVLKSCRGSECTDPWRQLHPQGNVGSLREALNQQYDDFYASQPKVMFSACQEGYLIEFEGPQTAMQYNGGDSGLTR
ncbi:uncharacterized protein Z518_05808 [Rhinocladiella mackenziei CBS 650.93]|uniref:Arylsulfatase n=1 Tax=Rhinocladiella mackenziei CBS 650.93 TaxID=1442369 RepID=A0A0D2FS12_9EURO|nr:uncharacterized protein Z518_05808 [Rhinocladiella mackenziei CBS 650.93]KIX04937.1 hypothetical protein Z518_05808 [Rhinocladiella mackenziei CBS 650.93]